MSVVFCYAHANSVMYTLTCLCWIYLTAVWVVLIGAGLEMKGHCFLSSLSSIAFCKYRSTECVKCRNQFRSTKSKMALNHLYLHDVLDGGCPSRELVGTLFSFFALWQHVASIAALAENNSITQYNIINSSMKTWT